MIVGDFDIKSIPVSPSETDSPLVVDSNAVLPRTIAFQSLQPITGRNLQIRQYNSIFQESKPTPRDLEQITRKAFHPLSLPDALREPVLEALDHDQ
jgi:hypothetical protein